MDDGYESNRAQGHAKSKPPLAAKIAAGVIVGAAVLGIFYGCGTVAGNAQKIAVCREDLTRTLQDAGSPREPRPEEIEACAGL